MKRLENGSQVRHSYVNLIHCLEFLEMLGILSKESLYDQCQNVGELWRSLNITVLAVIFKKLFVCLLELFQEKKC